MPSTKTQTFSYPISYTNMVGIPFAIDISGQAQFFFSVGDRTKNSVTFASNGNAGAYVWISVGY